MSAPPFDPAELVQLSNDQPMLGDWHSADVVASLRKRGTTLRQLARAHGYQHIQAALTRPWWAVEQLIAKTLGVSAEEIWPSRYVEGISRAHAIRLTRNRDALRVVGANRFHATIKPRLKLLTDGTVRVVRYEVC